MARITHSRSVLISFALASTAVVMCALLLVEWKGGTAAVESFDWVSHTLETQRELATIEARMAEAEAGEHGYLLTGDASYLLPYSAATNDVRERLASLSRLVADNPPQLRRIVRIDGLVGAKLSQLDSAINLARAGKRSAAIGIATTQRSDSVVTSIRSGLQGMLNAEQALLKGRQRDLAIELRQGDMISLALASGLALMLIALLIVARGAEHYRNLVTLCAWTRSVEYEGEWISFEEYLRRRFNLSATHGISPEAITQLDTALGEEVPDLSILSPGDELTITAESPAQPAA